jgi:hypothetical protein
MNLQYGKASKKMPDGVAKKLAMIKTFEELMSELPPVFSFDGPGLPWEQMEGESEEAYKAFRLYLKLRTQIEVAWKMDIDHREVHEWYMKYRWDDRLYVLLNRNKNEEYEHLQ